MNIKHSAQQTEHLDTILEEIREYYTQLPERRLKYLPQGREELIEKFCWLVACGDIIFPEYRLQWPHMAWWQDEPFTEYLQKFTEDKGFNTGRRWDLSQLLRLAAHVPGDMAECGTYHGASAFLMADACKKSGKHLHIFDSFEGLSKPDAQDGTHWEKHALTAGEDVVHRNLAAFAGWYTTYKGWIPARFEDVQNKQFSFVHFDVDLYQPTRDSIEFFYPRLASGAVCVCDDYGSTLCPGAKQAVDEFLADKSEKMLSLSGGSGFFVKGVITVSPE